MASRGYIADLAPNQLIEGTFAIQNGQMGLTKNGKPYLKCLLCDRTGRAPGRMWNASEDLINTLPTDGFVWIAGQTQPYQGEMQIIVHDIRGIEPTPDDLKRLLPSTKFEPDEMFAEVRAIMESMTSAELRALAGVYLADSDLMDRFRQAPAAQTLHHAFLGGLLEHTLGLLRLAEVVTPLYPKINRDIVLMGLFLHDLGKCVELTWATGFGYSDEGQLVGHIARGVVWLNQKAGKLAEAGTPLPQALLNVLEHIILSHHGVPEFGALKLPATPEAILIHMLDNIDAKMQMSLEACRPDREVGQELGGNFTEKVWALNNVRMYRGDPFSVDADAESAPAAKPQLKPKANAAPNKPAPETAPNQDEPMPKLRFGVAPPLKGGL